MTLKLVRILGLWAAILALALLWVLPFAGGTRIVAALVVIVALAWAWLRVGQRFAPPGQQLGRVGDPSLPPCTYRHPVVLVCGDGLAGLFGAVAVEQRAQRTTSQGCYIRVPAVDQLFAVANEIMAMRADWAGQLSILFNVNPGEHTDAEELAGRVRALCNQIGLLRKRGCELPLIVVSYLQAAQGEGAWFSWENAHPKPVVREAGACVSLADWQRQACDDATRAARLCSGVHISSAATWLQEAVLVHLESRHAHPPLACAITLVAVLPQRVAGNLWQQWLRDKVGLIEASPALPQGRSDVPFPDPLLSLLPLYTRRSAVGRAGVIACWLFAVAGVVALFNSAWQNNLLLRQVTDDLRRYTALSAGEGLDEPHSALRENAVAVLRLDASRLNDYYRQGEPLALGLGLYRGERLRLPLLAIVARHQQPPPGVAPAAQTLPSPVRLDSLSLFGTASAELKPGSAKVLITALVTIKARPGWLIVIAGHTDATGSPGQNLELSRARAASVRDWMQRMGDIPDNCFAVQGFGANQPVASNDTEVGRASNRRVDIRLVPQAGACALPATASGRHSLPHSAAFQR